MWKPFSRNRTPHEDQQRLFFALEKIVNVALVKTERGDNQSVKAILDDLESIFKDFWQLKKDNPDKFESLLWSKDFYEKYVIPLKGRERLAKDDLVEIRNIEELEKEAALAISFIPERELKGLTRFLNSFEKIWHCAFRSGNEEISKFVTYHLVWLLADLSEEPGNNLFVEEFLRRISSIAWKAIRNPGSTGKIDVSAYSAGIFWYTDIVFNRLRRDRGFDISYLGLFDRYFFLTARYIISEGKTPIFNQLVSSLVDGVFVPTYNQGKIWEYGHSILLSDPGKYIEIDNKHGIKKRLQDIASSEECLDTREKYHQWMKKFDELRTILRLYFDESQEKEASEIEKEIIEFADSQFKYNNLLEVVFAIGAYCLFKQKPEYIKYLWEYKQPPDSDASWIGQDIIPNNINHILDLHFRNRKFGFWEGHHGTEHYYTQYFILLLAHVLQDIIPANQGKFEEIEKYTLPQWDVNRISEIEHSIDRLVDIAKELRKQEELLQELGFTEIEELFDKKLTTFLQTLKKKAQEQIKNLEIIQAISPKKVVEFSDEVVEAFNSSAILRDVLNYCGLYDNKTGEEYEGKMGRWGINIVGPKSAFFEEWHISTVGFGKNLGQNLATGENIHLFNQIAKNCIKIEKSKFAETLRSFEDLSKSIVLATNWAIYEFFEKSKSFKPKWHKGIPSLDVKGFEGWYESEGEQIPVFRTHQRTTTKQILILNKSKLGRLVQYSPLNKGEDNSLQKNIFYVNIQDISKNQELMKNLVDGRPEWLQKVGNEKEQKQHLQKLVLMQIFERFEYDKHEEFEGYLLDI